jgi:hypothetical protein
MDMTNDGSRTGWRWVRMLGWGGAAALLCVPLIAMQFTREVAWTLGDFIFAGMMLGGVGLALELAVRISPSSSYRIGAGLGLAASVLLIWVTGAVGYIGSEENPYNLAFLAVVAIAFAGSVIAAFRPLGMAYAMLAAGIAHAIAGIGGAPQEPRTLIITVVFLGLWFGSARLFQLSAMEAQADAD